MKLKTLTLLSVTLLISQTSCIPVALLGGAGAIGYTAAQDRSVGATIDDAGIELQINAKYAKEDKTLYAGVTPDSVEGRVLLTGVVPTREASIKAYGLAWEVNGVKEVINEIKVDGNNKFSAREYASDTWISTQIKSKLLFTEDIKSVNYSVETINGTVYLMGIAQDKDELDSVTQIASEVRGVNKVVSYVRLKGREVRSGNASRNSIPVTEEEIGTVPGSVRAGSQSQGVAPQNYDSGSGSGGLIIEESPNAE